MHLSCTFFLLKFCCLPLLSGALIATDWLSC
jgi:hypothetical protein